jgi:ATP-binding cassette subfamily B protein RaxB
VLESVTPRTATISRPAIGRRTLSRTELDKHFTGVALELRRPRLRAGRARTQTRIRDSGAAVGLRQRDRAGARPVVLLQLTALLIPFFVQLTIDEGIAQGDTSLLLLLLIGFGIVYVLNGITRALRSWVVLTLGESLSFQLGGNVVRHLLRLPLGYFEKRHVGDLLSRIGSIQPIQALLSQGIVNVVIDSILAVTTLIVMMLISPTLTLLVVGTTILYLVVSLILFPGLRRRTEEEIMARAKEETYLMESMRAMRSIKLHTHERCARTAGATAMPT